MTNEEKDEKVDNEEASTEKSESKPENDKEKEEAEKTDESVEESEEATEKAEEAAEPASPETSQGGQAKEAVEEVKKTTVNVKEEAKEEVKQEPKKEIKVSGKLADIIKNIEELSVLELSELVQALEHKFGVTAAAPVAAAGSASNQGEGAEAGADEGQTSFNVILADGGSNKIGVIKVVRELVPSLGLKEAKDLVDAAPKQVLEGVGKEAANEAKKKFEAAGAKVELQ